MKRFGKNTSAGHSRATPSASCESGVYTVYMPAGGLVSVKWEYAFLQPLYNYMAEGFYVGLGKKRSTQTTGSLFCHRLPVAHFCLLMPSVIILRNK